MNQRLGLFLLSLGLSACGAGAEVDMQAEGWEATQSELRPVQPPIRNDRPSRPGRGDEGTWQLREVYESDHPYGNRVDLRWAFQGQSRGQAVKVVLERVDLEDGYDFLEISDGRQRHRITGQASGREIEIVGNQIRFMFTTDSHVVGWGYRIQVFEQVARCLCPAIYLPVCGDNGQTYGNSCAAACAGVPVAHDGACAPTYAEVTLEDLEAQPEQFDGQRIRVVAEPKAERAMCTLMACGPQNPCCNSCGAQFMLGQEIGLIGADGSNYGCGGNSCEWSSQCQPFARNIENGLYQFEGRFELGAYGEKTLRVDRFEAASCQKAGCSSHVCANTPVVTTCEWRADYACYAMANCAPQADGHCGWDANPAFEQCLASGGPAPIP